MTKPLPQPELAAVDYDPFAGATLSRVVPTTEPQREVWLASQLARQASLAYNESVSIRLRGPLDVDALRGAVQDLVVRHEALRATFTADGQDLCIAAAMPVEVPVADLAGAAADARDRAHREALRESVEEPFDLERGPLVRARILKLAGEDHVLVFSAHHIVCDGWSFGVIVRDLASRYASRIGRPGGDLAAGDSFADYAVAQTSRLATPEHAADEAFWVGRFSDAIPVLDLPVDRPRAATRTFASRRADHVLDADLLARVRQLGARHGASFFSALVAGFGATLARIAGTDELVIGIPFAGQSTAGHQQLVGHCVNLLPLRFAVDVATPLPAAIGTVQGAMLDAFEHPEYTFGTLLKRLPLARDPSRLPLVSVMFNLDQALDLETSGFPGLAAEFSGNPRAFENFELFVNAVQVSGTLRLECQYNADLFDAATIERWLACFETLLRDACANPARAVGSLAFASPADVAQIAHWNDSRRAFRRDARVHELFEDQARRTPERVAARAGGNLTTYGELDRQANRIARRLRLMGIGRGALVGLHVERSTGMLAAMLGVLKAGSAYVPLDPAYPRERLRFMAGDAGLAAW